MIKTAAVKFGEDQMPKLCLAGDAEIKENDHCVVQRDQSEIIGFVAMIEACPCLTTEQCEDYPKIIRRADEKEIEKWHRLQVRAREAKVLCKTKVQEHGLPMKISTVEIDESQNKIIFHFTADKRVDFRALVRDLASTLHARIELWQIGVRDEAKIIDGYGICGKRLCCSGFFRDFKPISIRMAKNQDIALAPSKLSGCCGRLMCCLAYEETSYVEMSKQVPNLGSLVRTDDLEGIVVDRNILKQTVQILDREDKAHLISVEQIRTVERLRDRNGRKIKRLQDIEQEAETEETMIAQVPPDDETDS